MIFFNILTFFFSLFRSFFLFFCWFLKFRFYISFLYFWFLFFVPFLFYFYLFFFGFFFPLFFAVWKRQILCFNSYQVLQIKSISTVFSMIYNTYYFTLCKSKNIFYNSKSKKTKELYQKKT